jgi:hypothetical protein
MSGAIMKRDVSVGTLWQLADAKTRMDIIPELGGKIVSVMNLASGRELLFQPTRPYSLRSPGDDFSTHDASGWDECFPSIAAEEFSSGDRCIRMPDHGEVWTLPFRSSRAGNRLELVAEGKSLPYVYRRSIALVDGRAEVAVEIENLSDASWAANWTLHALCRWEDDVELVSPPGVQSPTVPGRGGELKRWVGEPREGRCGFRYPSLGMELCIEWDITALPCLALWVTRGGFRGDCNLAWEPSMSASDALSEAIEAGTAQIWGPGETKSFYYSLAWASWPASSCAR